MEPPRFGRAGRPGSRLRAEPADPQGALGRLFEASPEPDAPPAEVRPPAGPIAVRPAHRPPAPPGPERSAVPGADDAGRPAAIGHHPSEPLLRLWWDDPRHLRPLPVRQPPSPAAEWPRPAISSGAPPPPYEGCRWPRACALLGRRLSCLSLLPCRCTGGVAVARTSDGSFRGSR